MVIYILAYRVDSLTYTLAKAFSLGSLEVRVRGVTREYSCDLDRRLAEMLQATPGVCLAVDGEADAPGREDTLIVQGHPRLFEKRREVRAFSRHAGRLMVISAGDRKMARRRAMALQWQELRGYLGRLSRLQRVLYKDGFYPRDLYGLFWPRSVIGFDVHSKFLHDPQAYERIHARDWAVSTKRPLLINFMGSRDPQRRARIIDAIRPLSEDARVKARLEAMGKAFLWHEYSDAKPGALTEAEYLRILTDSDFTLAPPGYSLVTHRPVEALLRGSIPVLNENELDLYDMGLEDGVNCIAVPAGQWPEAVERILGLSEEAIQAMRQQVWDLFASELDYPVLARNIRKRFGFDG